jgi:hypothetical protein
VYAVTVRLFCAAPATRTATEEIRQLIRTVSTPGDRLEHVYVQSNGYGADLVMFLIAGDLASAERTAARLVARAQCGGLPGCEPVTCQVELVLPFAEAALPPDPPRERPPKWPEV